MKRSYKGLFLSLVISILLVYLLISQISLNDLFNTLKKSNYKYILSAFIIYLVIYFIRSIRMSVLLKGELSIYQLFPIVCIHNFMNMLLPMKTGELSYSYLLKKKSKINLDRSLSNILVARIMDLTGILFLFSFSLFFYFDTFNLKLVSLILLLSSSFLLFMSFIFINKLLIISKFESKYKFLMKIKIFILSILTESTRYSQLEKIKIVIISLTINLLMFIFGYLLLKSFGVNLSIWAIFVGGTLAFLITLIPIQGLFNFGTLETAWTISYIYVGLTKEQAILTGFSYHIINILFTIIMFIIGIVIYRFKRVD